MADSPLSGGEFAFPGARALGCLLVHGFTATSDEMRPLGEALAAAGFPVLGVQLAGHGTSVDDLAKTGWRDWYASVTDGLLRLRRDVGRVAIVGMSTGALLGLHLAASEPDAVTALVLCATALGVQRGRGLLLSLAARVPPLRRRFTLIPKTGGRDIADPAVRATSRAYDAMPLAAVLELFALERMVHAELPRVMTPALLLHGALDHTVPVASMTTLRAALGSTWVEAHTLPRSWHVVTIDVDRAEVARLTIDFVTRVERAPVQDA